VACWTRARSLGAPIDGLLPEERLIRGEALRLRAEHVEVLRALGEMVLDRAAARVTDADHVLLLSDADGVIVHSLGGDEFAESARRLRLVEGACWSEAARGTNAIGTAAETNRPTLVRGRAHYGRRYHGIVCCAAPVRGVDGRPLAILDATSAVELADPELLGVVVETARALEDIVRLQAYAGAGASVRRALARSLDRAADPALLVESPGRIARANAAARAIFDGDPAGGDAGRAIGMSFAALAAHALSPPPGGRVLLLGRARRPFRLRLEPIEAADGAVLAVLVHLEPVGRLPSTRGRLAGDRAGSPASDPFAAIFAEDATLKDAIRWARQLAASELPVVLLAETGSGKELFAQAIHAASPRAGGPLVAVNCGSIAPTLLESELVGYAPSAFTGADRAGRPGLFHAASGGTLFLDEVAEMAPAMQAALLRVLETGSYRRVGAVTGERSRSRPGPSSGARPGPMASTPITSSSTRGPSSSRATSSGSIRRRRRCASNTTSSWPTSWRRPRRWPSAGRRPSWPPRVSPPGRSPTARSTATDRPTRSSPTASPPPRSAR
jgi:transcriptional regulator of acetoin/glycerol metabolism